jgi:SAM-dependent methyltransferase
VSGAADPWADWLLRRRDGGDAANRAIARAALHRIRDRLLAGVDPQPGEHVLDVGCGDGLIGLRAAELVGPTGRVVLSDISPTLLEHCRQAALAAGLHERCAYVVAALPELRGIADTAFDVVTDRSVLIYIPDKATALAAMHRVLRPGGRLGLFEPINRFTSARDPGRLWGFAVHGAEELAARVNAVAAADAPEAAAMLSFDERDLFTTVAAVGFVDVRMDYHAEVLDGRSPASSIEAFLATAPNPLAPTYAELLAEALSPTEAEILRAKLARAFAAGDHRRRSAVVHISATRAG